MVSRRGWRTLVLLGLLVLVVACRSATASPSDVTARYVAACIAGNATEVRSLLTPELAQLLAGVSGGPCDELGEVEDAGLYAEQASGDAADVEWAFTHPTGSARYRFALTRIDGEWRVAGGAWSHREESRETKETERVPAEVITRDDPNLVEEVAYVAEEGQEGQREMTRTQRLVNGEVVSDEVTAEQMTAEMQPMVVVVGKRPRAEVLADARAVVESYLTALAASDWGTVQELTYPDDIEGRDLPTIYETARFALKEHDVDDALELTIVASESLQPLGARRGTLDAPGFSGEVYYVPVSLVATVPIFVRYEVLGAEITTREEQPVFGASRQPGTMVAVYTPEAGWKVRYWGLLAAAAPGETLNGVTGAGQTVEVRLDGVAVLPTGTAIVTTLLQPSADEARTWPQWLGLFAGAGDDLRGGSSLTYLTTWNATGPTAHVWQEPLDPQANNVTVNFTFKGGLMPNQEWRAETVVPLVR